ncbi:SDR family NAD(P)-dependent oxidoreductase [Nocardia tengchongensis]|uniref:SDR family NAD(P)-dependent oxidoreductase n=1 Tax=Nocardia tengchongensis TaxID=2055889 RepID=UPI0036741E78
MTGALAVVTGADGGIGRATTELLAADGYRVLALDRRPFTSAAAIATRVADLSDYRAIGALVDELTAEFGVASVLVNNAGSYLAREFLDYEPEHFDQVMDVNLGAAFFLTQGFARHLIAAGEPGAVVNVGSISGQSGSPDAAYAASKGALLTLTRSLGRSLAAHRIRVNAVAPGIIETPMAARIPEDRARAYQAQIPTGRFGTAAEVAEAIRYLAGPAGSYVTASVLDVNGGLL